MSTRIVVGGTKRFSSLIRMQEYIIKESLKTFREEKFEFQIRVEKCYVKVALMGMEATYRQILLRIYSLRAKAITFS